MRFPVVYAAAALLAAAGPLTAQTAASPSSAPAPAPAASAEEAAVRAALQHYLDGHATGRGEEFAAVMHPEMKMMFIREGAFTQRTSAEYIAGASGRPAADEARRRRWIESVDVTGNAASAKIVLDYPTARLTDYMTLLKIDGQWKIVNKIFHAEPRQP
ncbi:MAG TPA: nuclear transport factor 2 family protein [Longimicrobium sp.]|nr:nuclear transport factor 2 family protein [Longimicrobium sp.]